VVTDPYEQTDYRHRRQGGRAAHEARLLLIDDGPIADVFLDRFKRAKECDPREHNFNPLPMTYRKAREFASVVFGDEGKDTLIVRNGKRSLTRMLMYAESLKDLQGDPKNDGDKEALAIVEDLLLPLAEGALHPDQLLFP
jgi:hypothetical protein